MTQKTFRFNPFNIKNWTDEELIEQYNELEHTLQNDDAIGSLAHDIEVYANLGYLIGEMVARYYLLSSNADSELKVNIANSIYRERNNWTKTETDKIPAMSYFESKAHSLYLTEIKQLNELEANLKRFKYAYDSIESKQNALKKKLESVRFDTFGR